MSDFDDETIDFAPERLEELKRRALEQVDDTTNATVLPQPDLAPVSDAAGAPDAPPDPAEPADAAGAAAAFVEDARQRAEAEAEANKPEQPKKSRRGLWIVLAVVLGAQILAGGVWFALNALNSNEVADEPLVEPTLAPLEPTALPTSIAGPTSVPTPTPIPPTPVWVPTSEGPRVSPFTYIVEAIVREPRFFDAREGAEIEPTFDGIELPLMNPTTSGAPLILRVVTGQPDSEWAQVSLPGDGDSTAWIKSEEFVWRSTDRMLQVNIADNLLTVFEGNTALMIAPVTSGSRSNPTPPMSTWVLAEMLFDSDNPSVPVLRFAGFADMPRDRDGLPTMRLGVNDDQGSLGSYATAGQILIGSDMVADLQELIDVGSRVDVIGSPPRPTPTPAPTPTRVPPSSSTLGGGAGSGGGATERCPGRASGTPPNCYEIVQREVLQGQCTAGGSAVEIDGKCMVLAGDAFNAEGDEGCPATAGQQIGIRCYRDLGPVPTSDGPCPSGARDVGGECRRPVG